MAIYVPSDNALAGYIRESGRKMKYWFRTFGCQQNVSDSQRMAGLLSYCGMSPSKGIEDADVIIFNTCAVREHAEDRVFGNVGAIKSLKERRPGLVIAVGGCMVQQQHIADIFKKSYPFVDIVFNTNRYDLLPDHIYRRIMGNRIYATNCSEWDVIEGPDAKRDRSYRAFIPVMYGCDNFCSYCIVPYVRGRERSRIPSDILAEVKSAVDDGYRDIMLLGQNVNSYGKGLTESVNFTELLYRVNEIPGEFKIRFMTSHPKDATTELFKAIADCEKLSNHIHLPVQSGSNDILKRMNRKYTREDYLRLIDIARENVPDISFTSDIIVGFPDESDENFEQTLDLVKQVGYRSLFTFIYSKRVGTVAAEMPDAVSYETKTERMSRLMKLQNEICEVQEKAFIGHKFRVQIVNGMGEGTYEARLDDNTAVTITGNAKLYCFTDIIIEDLKQKRLYGKVI